MISKGNGTAHCLAPPMYIMTSTSSKIQYSTKEIQQFSSLSRRMILKRIKRIRKDFPTLISGGGRGKTYWIHHSLLNRIAERVNSSQFQITNNREHIKRQLLVQELATRGDWTFYGMISPASEMNNDELINLIPKNLYRRMFFSIHEKSSNRNPHRHIHFVLESDIPFNDLKNAIRNGINKKIQPFLPSLFDECLRSECVRYFTENHKNQCVVYYDLMPGGAPPAGT